MHELVKIRHGVENISISDLVAEKESSIQITHNPFLAKILIKGTHWGWEIEHAIEDMFGIYPERGRAVSNNSWCAVSWGGNEYLMISTETLLLEKALDDHYQSKEGGIVMVDLSSAYECISISGIAAIDLIKACCFLDVDETSFPNNGVATCRLGPFCVVLQKKSQAPLFDFYIERSLAIPFVKYLAVNGYPFKVAYLKS